MDISSLKNNITLFCCWKPLRTALHLRAPQLPQRGPGPARVLMGTEVAGELLSARVCWDRPRSCSCLLLVVLFMFWDDLFAHSPCSSQDADPPVATSGECTVLPLAWAENERVLALPLRVTWLATLTYRHEGHYMCKWLMDWCLSWVLLYALMNILSIQHEPRVYAAQLIKPILQKSMEDEKTHVHYLKG